MKKLFGTDGIRAVAGQAPLDPATIHAVGLALAHHLGDSPRVLIGQDTRESSAWIGDALTAGLESTGAGVASAGVVTTPAVAYLAHSQEFSAGIVISASHNPWQDNGIKVFGHDGYKLADAIELEIEKEIFALIESNASVPANIPKKSLPGDHSLAQKYEQWLAKSVSGANVRCGAKVRPLLSATVCCSAWIGSAP